MRIIKSYFVCFLSLIFLCSCVKNKTEIIKRNIENMRERPISLLKDEMEMYYHKGDEYNKRNIDKKYKLIVYIDKSNCSTCYLRKLKSWGIYLDSINAKCDNLESIFVLSPQKEEINEIKRILSFIKLDYPLYLDTIGKFEKSNPHIPKEHMYHTFLLDKNSNVVFVGDPLDNRHISKKLLSIIEKKNNLN